MIGRLRGILIEKAPPHLLLEVGGMGYELDVPMYTFYKLPEVGAEVTLYTHFVVREDAQLLFGFLNPSERSLFRNLLKVNNVGPKMALAILSGIEPDAFVHCVLNNDSASLVKVPGVGKKTAERLIIEMRDRVMGWYSDNPAISPTVIQLGANTITQEAISALIALGYKPQEASRAIAQIEEQYTSSEQLIRQALKNMLKGTHHDSSRPAD